MVPPRTPWTAPRLARPTTLMDEAEVLPHVYDRLAQDRRRNGIAWWPLGTSYLADPYPDLRRLRETAPCLRCSLRPAGAHALATLCPTGVHA